MPRWMDQAFRAVTHLGGTGSTVGLALLCTVIPATRSLGLTLTLAHVLSHASVQLLKRTVVRGRPASRRGLPEPLTAPPDAYSFPSGHSCASLTTALVLTSAAPSLGVPFLLLALTVGFSRIYLR
ncbi:MAG: phosphatase PAP2 family protein, partial [Gemmatimonadales bacterium]